MEKITHRITVAYAKTLSYAVFILPQSIIKSVDKKCRDYLWDCSEEKRKVVLISWEKVCLPKKFGGLSIKSCRLWNIASVGKFIWQLARKKDTLWVRWVHGIYMKESTDIWEHQSPTDCSWYWREINSIKLVMRMWYINGVYNLTGNGEYSVFKRYNALLGRHQRLQEVDLIWCNIMVPRHRFILWLANQGKSLTKERPRRLNIHVDDDQCGLCPDSQLETHIHLFSDCRWIKEVKEALSRWTGVPFGDLSVQQMLIWVKRRRWSQFQFKKALVTAIWGAMIYHTWKARNWKHFKETSMPPELVVAQVQKEVRERIDQVRNTKRASSGSYLIQQMCS